MTWYIITDRRGLPHERVWNVSRESQRVLECETPSGYDVYGMTYADAKFLCDAANFRESVGDRYNILCRTTILKCPVCGTRRLLKDMVTTVDSGRIIGFCYAHSDGRSKEETDAVIAKHVAECEAEEAKLPPRERLVSDAWSEDEYPLKRGNFW